MLDFKKKIGNHILAKSQYHNEDVFGVTDKTEEVEIAMKDLTKTCFRVSKFTLLRSLFMVKELLEDEPLVATIMTLEFEALLDL